mmetsp:Transcript_3278/g.8793  ORF Transcript_3278/g.8793 Transcript_3278/m.8793 type:complete len:414 (+) Transcript_3278:155-1396(+)
MPKDRLVLRKDSSQIDNTNMSPKDEATMSAARSLRKNLLADLKDDNEYFDQLVDMIPMQLYIKGESGDDYNSKYFKGQAKESKEARRAKLKLLKRQKFDPAKAETTTQAQARLGGAHTMPRKPPKQSNDATPSATKHSNEKESNGKDAEKLSRIEALRAKLQAKIAEKRGNRPTDPNTVSKRAARRAAKQKRQEEAIKKNKKKSTSNAENSSGSNKRLKISPASAGMVDPSADLAQMDFGRLSGLNPVGNGNYSEVNKALKNLSKTKNLEKLLADAESKKKRLEELKKSDRPEDKEKAANIAWGDALKEADGKRVKDDPAKIKKALKRKASKKLKSAKAWKTRMDTTKSKMDERQKIRNHNLSRRKMGGSAGANLSSKRIELANENNEKTNGRRQSRAGFEGKKQDFLNKKEQ